MLLKTERMIMLRARSYFSLMRTNAISNATSATRGRCYGDVINARRELWGRYFVNT
jgi:hypothetical protein